MRKILVLLMIACAMLMTACASQNDKILSKLDELEQRVSQLEQQAAPFYTTPEAAPEATPFATETPQPVPPDIEDGPAAYFMYIVPDSFIPFADESSIIDAALMKEYDRYGITLHYAVASDADTSIIEEYFHKIVGADADFSAVTMGSGAMFSNETGDVYYAGFDPMGEGQMTVYLEVQFAEADLSEAMNDPDIDISKYYLDEIFDKSPTMVRMAIVKNEYQAKSFYYEYKYEDTDYGAKIKQVYADHNIAISAEDESEIIYSFADGVEVRFETYIDSNRVNIAVTYYN